jgi:hypothetical protein
MAIFTNYVTERERDLRHEQGWPDGWELKTCQTQAEALAIVGCFAVEYDTVFGRWIAYYEE